MLVFLEYKMSCFVLLIRIYFPKLWIFVIRLIQFMLKAGLFQNRNSQDETTMNQNGHPFTEYR